jgi:hypothetical protein
MGLFKCNFYYAMLMSTAYTPHQIQDSLVTLPNIP